MLAVAVFLALGVLFFPSAGWDDAYISYWAAHALADLGRIVNVNGDYVEQSSSLGLVLLIALIRRLTAIDASIIGRLASIAFGAATVVATARLGQAVTPATARAAPLLVATCTYFVYWSFGGMEATMAAWAAVWLLIVLGRVVEDGSRPARLAMVAALALVYVLARPEGAFVLGTTLAGLAGVILIRRRWRLPVESWETHASRRLSAIVVASCAAVLAVLQFRLWYFGRVFPQAVYAKTDVLSRQRLIDGLQYVLASITSDFLLIAGMGAVAAWWVLWPRRRSRTRAVTEVVAAVFLVANLAFIITSGGDGMHGGRFFVPVIPAVVVLGVAWLSRWLSPRALKVSVAVLTVVQVGGLLGFARYESHSDPVWVVPRASEAAAETRFNWFERANHDHRRYFPIVNAMERRLDQALAVRTPVSILSGQSGFVMYHLGRTRFASVRYFDRFALATRDFLECPISHGLPRTEWGLLLTVDHFLRRMDDFRLQCAIPAPDIIFELYWGAPPADLRQTLEQSGYAAQYFEGVTAGRSGIFPGREVGHVYVANVQGR